MPSIDKNASKDQVTISLQEINEAVAPQAKPGRPAKPKKPKPIEIYQVLTHVAQGGDSPLPEFEGKFHVIKDEKGEHAYVEELDGQVLRYVSRQRLTDVFCKYSANCGIDDLALTAEHAEKCVKYWASQQDAFDTDLIAPVRQLNEPGYTYHRLPFDISDGPTPLFDDFIGRNSEGEALMAFYGSLLDWKADLQQYVWLYGDGEDGKSAQGRFLEKILGPSIVNKQVPQSASQKQFFNATLLGKRLALFPDCNNYAYPLSGDFKQLTGNDSVPIEYKGQNQFKARLACKFLFYSNDKPTISGKRADIRRVIYSEVSPYKTYFGKTYEDDLYKEAPHVLYKCIKKYQELSAEFGTIKTSGKGLNHLIESNEERFALFVDTYLETDVTDPTRFTTAKEMNDAFRNFGVFSEQEKRHYKAYMQRVHNIVYDTKRIPGKGTVRCYVSSALKAMCMPPSYGVQNRGDSDDKF